MRIKYNWEPVKMGEGIILVPVGEGAELVHGVLKLNEAGMEIINLLKEETTEADIVRILVSKYDNNQSELENYVHHVLAILKDYKLLTI